MNALHLFFHWPDGGIYSNLIASGITALVGFAWGRRKLIKLENHLVAQDEQHQQLHADIKQTHELLRGAQR